MTFYNPGCLGDYDFDNIVFYARKRFIEGCNTIDLLQNAKSTREKEEVALVAMLDLDDSVVENMKLYCKHAGECQVTNCRYLIKQLIEAEFAA